MAVTHYDQPNQPRFLTYSCYQRRPLLQEPGIRDDYLSHLEATRQRLCFKLFAWVVMPEHVHLIVLPSDGSIRPVLRGLKQGFGQRTIRAWNAAGDAKLAHTRVGENTHRFWQRGGGYDRNVRSYDELRKHAEYIHANPVRRGLAECPEDWRWSSFAAWHGLPSSITPDRII